MWKTKLINTFSLSKSTKKQIKVGVIAAFAAFLLQYSTSFHMTLSVVLFVVFSLYLYLDRLQDKISLLQSITKDLQERTIESENVKTKEADIDLKQSDKSKEELRGSQQNSDFSLNLEKLEQRLIQSENSINNFQNSIDVFAQRLDRVEKTLKPIMQPKSTKDRPSRPLRENNSGQDIQKKLSELSEKFGSLSDLENRLNQLQATVQRLETAQIQQSELESLQNKVQKSDQMVTKFTETLAQLSQNAAIDAMDQRVLNLEAKGLLLEDMMKLIENTNDRLSKDENSMKVLSDSILAMGDSVNLRVDGLSQIMKDYFTDISRALSRNK